MQPLRDPFRKIQKEAPEKVWENRLTEIERIFGHSIFAEAYFAVMHCDSRNRHELRFPRSKEATEELFKILPDLETIIKLMQKRTKHYKISYELKHFLNKFYQVSHYEIRKFNKKCFLQRLGKALRYSDQSIPQASTILSNTQINRIRSAFVLFVGKVVDSYEIYTKSIPPSILGVMEGIPGTYGLTSICEDLKAFRKKCKNGDPVIERVISVLEFAPEISLLEANDDSILKKAEKIVEKLNKQLEGEPFLIPAGFPGHMFLYQITKDDSNLFSFTIIETAGGFKDKSYNYGAWGTMNKDKKWVFKGITLADLSLDFFLNLWRVSQIYIKQNISMRDIYMFLKSCFGKSGVAGSLHCRQLLGTCAIKSVLAWLAEQLPEKMYLEFDSFMINRAMRLVQVEYNSLTEGAQQILFDKTSVEEIINEFQIISESRISLNEEMEALYDPLA